MEFQTPTILDVDRIRSAMKHNTKRGCEMSVANTILWARHYHTEIAFDGGDIIFRSMGENGRYSYCINLLDAKDAKSLFQKVVRLAREQEQPLRIYCVTEPEWELLDSWYPGQYRIQYNRDGADYIYLREKLAVLSGKKLHGKRNHIHRFEDTHPDWQYEAITDENEEECAAMAMQWCMNNCMSVEDEIEFDKIDESKLVVYAIRHRKELGMTGGALRVSGKVAAITLGERLTDDTFVVHFEKAFSDIQGAYPMINREFVKNELADYMYVNREEDLGISGLRKAKLSYYPEILLEKGTVTAK